MWLVWIKLLLFLKIDYSWGRERIHIPVGALFDPSNYATVSALKYAFWLHQNASGPFVAEVVEERIDWVDTYQVSRAVCRLLQRGVFAIVAPTTPQTYSVLVSYSNNFQVPLVSPSFPEVIPEQTPLFAVSIQPNTLRAVNDLITYYRWHSIIYLYQTEDGAEKLQRLFEIGGSDRKLHLLGIRRVTNAEDARLFFVQLDTVYPDKIKNVIMDVEPRLARDIIIAHVRASHWESTLYHFLLVEPVPEGFWNSQLTEFGRVNITGFRLLDPDRELVKQFLINWRSLDSRLWHGAGNRNIPVEAMLTYDGAELLLETFTRLYDTQQHVLKHGGKSTNGTKGTDCLQNPIQPWEYGPIVAQYLKQTHIPAGLTGSLRLDPNGQRKYFTLDVIETTPMDYVKAGTWSDMSGLMLVRSPYQPLPDKDSRTAKKAKYVITSIVAEPYLSLKKPAKKDELITKDQVEGYAKDLIDYLAEEMNFEYDLYLVSDGSYGKYNSTTRKWTGLVGELTMKKADMAVAPLTVTSEREVVVDFTKPYKNVGLSVMMKKPTIGPEIGAFFFLKAFSVEVWICVIVAHLVLGMLIFFLTKLTLPPDRIKSPDAGLNDRLGLCASFWFVCGSSLFRSSGIYPKSLSSRLISIFLWLFTLILLGLYIANLVTILMKDRSGNGSPLPTARSLLEEAVKSGHPKIGILKGGSSFEFFKNSAFKTDAAYWQLIKDEPDLLSDSYVEGVEKIRNSNGDFAFILESSVSEYISNREPCDTVMAAGFLDSKEYAVATPKGSSLREDLDYALLSLKEKGYLNKLYTKWWNNGNCKVLRKRKLMDLYHSALTLYEVSGLFYLLVGGIVISIIIAVVEWIFRRRISGQSEEDDEKSSKF